tara:strand:- start:363 stop:848 length:486 start_codon:yes stop_codon:yes gene_type:complete
MATLFMGTACTDDPTGSSARGRNLEIYSDFPEIVDQAVFELDGKTRLFAPSASNREIVVVNTKITNRTTTVIPIVVDTESVMLGDRRGKKYPPINPYNVESVNSEEAVNASPILWGTFELARGYQIEGFLIFDVPKGLLLGTLFWDEVEYIPVDFVNYLEN